ncbi:P-loop containing nucleoside triphosphate hydrolase protein [Schizopora paradoxa]|uniref:p-loop containing nucleoside triphosphate hydrolase protein n=1 Tax=Schizopora paradoxa TaxID=27342 RepID=A0A0H2RH66_9AGAM|nr:P-loop containing nucleoside triphosphate hydrolase protein [Schizopora paradoxa]
MDDEINIDVDIPTDDLLKKRVGRYDYYYDLKSSAYALRRTSKPKKSKASHKHKYALSVRRVINDRRQHERDIIDIKSPQLCEVLLKINEDVEGINLRRSEPEATPEIMFHSYDGLLRELEGEEQKDLADENLILDIKSAIYYIEKDQDKTLRDFEKLADLKQTTFDLLWALFKPNTLVYNHHVWTQQDRLLIVRGTDYCKDSSGRNYLEVHCDFIHDDGYLFGFARESIEIYEFRGAIPISDLTVYPLRYRDGKEGIFEKAVDSGRTFARMNPHSYHEYTGQGMREIEVSGGREVRTEKFFTSGRVMISPVAFRQYASYASYNRRVRKAVVKEELTDEQLAICTPILLGFSFERKIWGAFAMSRLQDVNWNEDAFRALVLGEKQKKLIHALVRKHASESNRFDDVIVGKGRGLIGLLAGPPGCGKTLTAEAVAETTHKPLYAVSAGELGTTPEDVDYRLKKVLELAQMWDAVLLLDEAEVFLQQRDITNVMRNALVSIFLRQLEYYQGILILTTNMPEQCDAAFESRIHFSINYPKLGVSARKSVWRTFFNRAKIEIGDADLDRLAARDINGRQIKNAFSSAMTISIEDGSTKLGLEHIDDVLEVLSNWQSAMQITDATKRSASGPNL